MFFFYIFVCQILSLVWFISRINTISESLKAGNTYIFQHFGFYERLKFHAQLSCARKKLYNLRTRTHILIVAIRSNLPVSDNHHFVSLDYLLSEEINKLEVFLVTDFLHGLQEDPIVSFWETQTREQVRDDTVEQRNIMGQKLG